MLDEIITQSQNDKSIENILEKYDWKKFERVVAEIFQENGFYTKQNFRFKTTKRHEIDVLAVKNDRIFCIDCKLWGKGRYKKNGLKNAIVSQEERVKELQRFLTGNPIVKNTLKVIGDCTLNSLIVTLHEENLIKEGETFIVPIWKLNRFITELEHYF